MKHHHGLEWEEIEEIPPEEPPLTEEEEKLLERAEEIKAEKLRRIEGPWKLRSKVKPYGSKKFKVEEAKKTLDEE